MILLKITRQDLVTAKSYFAPFMLQWRTTNFKNVSHLSTQDSAFLSAIAVNCIIDDLLAYFADRLFNTSNDNIKLKLSDANAVILYRMLLIIPIPVAEVYLNTIRNEWIGSIHQQLILMNLYSAPEEQNIFTKSLPYQ